MWHVLYRLLMILGVLGVYHRLNTWYPLLLRGVCTWILRKMSFGHTSRQHVRWARLFFEVRNAYTAVFDVVVGTIDLLLLRGPSGLTQVLEALLQALREVSIKREQYEAVGPTFCSTSIHFSPTRAARMLHISRRTAIYACARSPSLTPSHCSAFCRSINRSCLLRQAFGDFCGKCFGEI